MSDGTKKILSILGLILAILSIVFCWTIVLSIILAVVAVVFGAITLKSFKGRGIASIVLGVVGVVFSIFIVPLYLTIALVSLS